MLKKKNSNNWKEGRKGNRGKNEEDRKNNKMVDLNSTIAIVALNLNGLNTAIKNRYYHIGLGGIKDPIRLCL